MPLTALDFEQIKQLHARYCHSIDFGDIEGVVACWAPDGAFDAPQRVHDGAQELREFAADVSGQQGGHVRHSMISSLIDGDGDTARSLSYAIVTHDYGALPGKGAVTHATMLTSGIYADQLEKLGGRWVYRRRTFRWDGTPPTLERVGQPLDIQPVASDGAAGGLSALDHEAIRQLMARYGYTLDFEDHDGFIDCFMADGAFESLSDDGELTGGFRGREALREFAAAVGGKAQGSTRHAAISLVIEGDGEVAHVSSYGFVPVEFLYRLAESSYGPRTPRGNVAIGTTGIYRDKVVKVNGRWRFARRTFRSDGWPDVMDLMNRPVGTRLFGG
jgi:ketosteroid isomerase-like protein